MCADQEDEMDKFVIFFLSGGGLLMATLLSGYGAYSYIHNITNSLSDHGRGWLHLFSICIGIWIYLIELVYKKANGYGQ